MKILFDISNLLHSDGGGIHYYLRGLLAALLKEVDIQQSEMEFLNIYFRNKPISIPSFIKSKDLHHFRFPVKLLNKLWLNFNFPDLAGFYKGIDIVHSPHFSLPTYSFAKKVLTVHDITYLKHPEFFDSKSKKLNDYGYKQLLPVNIKRADHIIAISDFTKNDLIDYFHVEPQKITTVYTGVDIPSKGYTDIYKDFLKKFNLNPGEYIYFPAGSLELRKNIPLTIEAFKKSEIPENIKLVISGVGKIDWLDFTSDDRIRMLRWDSTEERDVLYQNACFIVYPSLYEGFGMPVVEAMSNGKAVITSNTTALSEIAGGYAHTVNPESLDELIAAFDFFSNQNNRRNYEEKSLQRAKDFSWEKMAEETFDIYEKILGK